MGGWGRCVRRPARGRNHAVSFVCARRAPCLECMQSGPTLCLDAECRHKSVFYCILMNFRKIMILDGRVTVVSVQ